MIRQNKNKIAATLLVLLLSGCSLAPQYQRPDMAVPDNFVSDAAEQAGTPGQAMPGDLGWREVFTDPLLQELINNALLNNRNLRETALTVEAYQAQYRIQRAAQLPSVTGSGYGQRQRTLSSSGYRTGETYSLEVGITSYELDLFGRIRNLKDQALEQYLAMEESRKSSAISLIANVAQTYLNWLADKELLQITEDTRQTEEESYSLIKQRVSAGISTDLELAQARTSLESVKAYLALYRRQVAQDLNYLTLLTGTKLPPNIATSARSLKDVEVASLTPPSLSSEVLLQRPDVMAAEHELKGANANIGAARAAFFPKISITTSAGLISTELSNLFDSNSGSWLFAPAISLPIFTAGQLQAELDTARIQKNIYITRYESAIQTAFQEVSDALIADTTYREQLMAQEANLTANEDYYSRAHDRYQEGVDSFLTLLDAQRSLYSSKQNYVTQKLAQLANQVTLYKVFGGGVKEYTEQQVTPATQPE